MSWMLVRLDDRLLHGQVAVGWVGRLHPRRIVVADDRMAESAWERELVEASAPEGVRVQVMGVEAAGRIDPTEAGDALLLLRSPQDLLRLVRAGVRFSDINVGGLHAAAGKQRILDYVYLDAADAAALREAADSGARVTAQDVPGNPVRDVLDLAARAGM